MIVGVQINFENDIQYRLPKPFRHCDVFLKIYNVYDKKIKVRGGVRGQGFYTDKGEFLNQEQAMSYVREWGIELLPMSCGDVNGGMYLFSEDLW